MALKSTIFKAQIQLADMDRNLYSDYALTLARHPSETDERMMVRLLAFALYADPALTFGKGLCTDDEPDLWQRGLDGSILRWIDVGLPDEKWIRKACNRAAAVALVAYGKSAHIWWNGIRNKIARQERLQLLMLPPEATEALTALTNRSMKLQVTIQDRAVWMTDGNRTVSIEPVQLLP